MLLRTGIPGNSGAIDPQCGNALGQALLCLGDDGGQRLPQGSQRAPLRLGRERRKHAGQNLQRRRQRQDDQRVSTPKVENSVADVGTGTARPLVAPHVNDPTSRPVPFAPNPWASVAVG